MFYNRVAIGRQRSVRRVVNHPYYFAKVFRENRYESKTNGSAGYFFFLFFLLFEVHPLSKNVSNDLLSSTRASLRTERFNHPVGI